MVLDVILKKSSQDNTPIYISEDGDGDGDGDEDEEGNMNGHKIVRYAPLSLQFAMNDAMLSVLIFASITNLSVTM